MESPPQPLSARSFNEKIAKFFPHKIVHLPVPERLIRMVAGDPTDVIVKGQRVTSKTLEKAKFRFRYGDIDSALREGQHLSQSKKRP